MGRLLEAVSSQRCRIQPPPLMAVAAIVLACLVSHACGSCLSYGHSCWGAHGKRSGGGQGARWSHVGREQIDAGSDRISRGAAAVPLGAASPPPTTPNSEDTLWLISKLMEAATTQLEPEVGEDEEAGEDHTKGDEEDDADAKIWRRLLDVNQGVPFHRLPKALRTSKVHLEKLVVPPQTELGSGVGIIGFASAVDGDLGKGLVVLTDDPEENEDESEDETNDFEGREISKKDGKEDQEDGKRLSRKALRRLKILNLWHGQEK
ncbi:uncharacterized protein LOC124165434 isoform X2 [Ischnura elegans]|uniref:uncharacterized protein LOC124165434 isoform X2 n=1 Tax=Ischnura elegans TaxID=197161 RepID=UPI001ED86CC3|nr:uncharacterized protein LOC124165434 isoform X2 [Ischnura elegans]